MLSFVALDILLTAIEGILLWCPRMVGYLQLASLLRRVLVQIDIRNLGEAIMGRFCGGVAEVVMDVCEPSIYQPQPACMRMGELTLCSRASPRGVQAYSLIQERWYSSVELTVTVERKGKMST